MPSVEEERGSEKRARRGRLVAAIHAGEEPLEGRSWVAGSRSGTGRGRAAVACEQQQGRGAA